VDWRVRRSREAVRGVEWSGGGGGTYPLLRKTTGTLVLGVAEEFDDTLLVGSKTVARVSVVLWRRSGNCEGAEQTLRSAGPLQSTKKVA
jgi:hypothetical protein